MQTLQLMRKDGTIIRVLKLKDGKTLVIDCLKRTMPVWTLVEGLDGYEEIEEEELHKATGIYPVDIEKLDAERRRIAFQRFTLIMGILPRVGDDVERNYAISSAAEFFGKSKEMVRMYLCRYLAFQSISALAPMKREQEMPLTDDQKNIRWALNKYFYKSKRLSLPMAYTLMLKERYCNPEGKLLPNRPSYYQFRYFFRKHRKQQNYLISRNGLADYQRNDRPLLGDGVQEFAPAPGTAMLDSTVLDIYLVDDAKRLLGRPILSAATDTYSGVCLGYSLSFEAGVYSLRTLLRNVLEDKVDHCRKHGIRILPNSWDVSGVLPGTIVTDKGSDYASQCFSQIAELGVTVVNLPPYRPELKGPIEKFFDVIQSLFKPILKGKGVIDMDYQERGAHDYRKDACLTLDEFERILLQCIIYYNSHRVLEHFPFSDDMLAKSVPPHASDIWNYARSLPGTHLIPVSESRLMMTLLPRTEGRFSRSGLLVKGMRYVNKTGFTEQYLTGGKVTVAYNPDDVSTVWLVDKGDYIEFELIEARYRNKSLSETAAMKTRQRNVIREAEERNQQAKINLVRHIQTIAATAQRYGDIDIRGVREARKKARRDHHSDVMQEVKRDE
jgi:transposase InsO family protein